jgi:hypothetical protein
MHLCGIITASDPGHLILRLALQQGSKCGKLKYAAGELKK